MRATRVPLASLLALLTACAGDPTSPNGGPPPGGTTTALPVLDTAPSPRREFRGAWVATVSNIDWPSRAGLSAAQQQAELAQIVAGLAGTRLNAVVLQVRPAADALYASPYEPWSRVLTGTQGNGPGYDPLAFAVQQAHAAGLELHAWFNPFRAGLTKDTATFAATHVWRARRDLARVYGTQLWTDPGEPEVQDRTIDVILDVVRRYDVDAVHLDDYFYPYLERDAQNRIIDFPDSATFARNNPNRLSRDVWRRDNVNRFVARLYRAVHAVKPWVRVGISPFGIWRPGNPPGITGLDAYSEIYADSKLWLNNGWADYFAPQLYWTIDAPAQSYTALLGWWASQNTQGRHLWPGNASYRVNDGTATAFRPAEMSNQVAATRALGAAATGNIFYNATSLFARGAEVSKQLTASVYADAAIPPATPWLDATPPGTPQISVTEGAPQSGARVWVVHVTPAAGEAARWWVVQHAAGAQWIGPAVVWGADVTVELPVPMATSGGRLDAVVVRAADAVWNLSAPAQWRPTAVLAAH